MRSKHQLIRRISAAAILACFFLSPIAFSQTAPGSLDVHWNEGASDCKEHPQPPLQVHSYNAQTFIIRENLCYTFEAPFLYLLIGTQKAILVDTGDVTDPKLMPLAATVLQLLPASGSTKLPLLVVHTHRHLDHRAGDGQFTSLPNVQVVGYDIDSVRRFYHFTDWPNGKAEIDLGDRIVDVIPTPGHNETEVSFYDRNTGVFLSGDFLMPARLLIDDTRADLASAERVAEFVHDRPVSYVLGNHIEMNAQGELYPWGAQYHPNEHALQLKKDDLLALPAAIAGFNGLYSTSGQFVLMNSMRLLVVFTLLSLCVLAALVVAVVWLIKTRRRGRLQRSQPNQSL
ncbi:MAG TPA: MBL fold metallo-hydrolase [Candidatus Sulfotelmatobacter sp.]|nr:MBL fold metallo-hydrolase [Candidatus Sulfotelmatobacter sp.]